MLTYSVGHASPLSQLICSDSSSQPLPPTVMTGGYDSHPTVISILTESVFPATGILSFFPHGYMNLPVCNNISSTLIFQKLYFL